jgi:hypothetical protein
MPDTAFTAVANASLDRITRVRIEKPLDAQAVRAIVRGALSR